MKTRILITFVMAALFASSAAFAQNPLQRNRRMDRRAMLHRQEMRQNFNRDSFLTDDQKEAMKKIRMETAKEIKPLKNQLRELQAHQQTLATADNADLKAIYKNIDKMSEVKTEMAKILAKQRLDFRSLLTDEQRLKMDQRRDRIRRGERPFMKNRMENRNKPGYGNGA
ncbi:MAG TPA: Spy/CpxP family protein refolding chaperone [Draconibacterium sp.]|nr:Spy/CpxP family protein refolding chaperone [Draconibacterium sp.]